MHTVIIGKVCQILDEANVKYHHNRTWYRLFLNKKYAIGITYDLRIVVYECEENKSISYCINSKQPKIFEGNTDEFKEWLYTTKARMRYERL